MINALGIDTPQLTLSTISAMHAQGSYLAWMNDPNVVRYTESYARRFEKYDLEQFIDDCNKNPLVLLLGMFDKVDKCHVGNIKLGPIDARHRRGDVGLIVGDKTKWGRGFGREAISAITDYAFKVLGLAKVTAGCYAPNLSSVRAFLAAGWHEEGRRRRHGLLDGKWEDEILLARFVDD